MKLKYKLFGIELISLLIFFIVIIIFTGITSIFSPNLGIPLKDITQESLQSMGPNEMPQIKDSLSAYLILFIVSTAFILILGLIIYNASRYYIWRIISEDKPKRLVFDKRGIKKYFIFNTLLTLIVSIGAVIIYYALQEFFKLIPYLLQYIRSTTLQQILTIIIPITLLYYVATNIIYNANYLFEKNNQVFKIKELRYQIKPSIKALIGIFLFNWILLVLVKPGSFTANIIGSIAFLSHITYLKLSVKNFYENDKFIE